MQTKAWRTLLRIWLFSGLLAASAAQADVLSAVHARERLAAGAVAWDVQASPTVVVASALRADAQALRQWQQHQDLAALSRAVSASGIDLSREVVIYGHAGDAQAQALYAALQSVATGRVHWLVGGIEEWQAAGGPVAARASTRAPVPQHLVARDTARHDQPAVASLRRTSTEGLALRTAALD
jgi:3-mercaptopyruvate sulfurtransferase SseA